MRYLSLFSGIEAATLAWAPLGWTCVGLAEIESYPCSLLKHYYPNIPNLGDVTRITEAQIAALGRIDIIIFGSPCQDLSLAGNRKGLAGERSGLFHTAIDIIRWARKHCGLRYALWENVPGAFTSNQGRDFAAVVRAMGCLDDETLELPVEAFNKKGAIKWGNEGVYLGEEALVEWSTLDAQWFGVAQRRRRVFALADFGDWAGRPPVLLEPESLRGDSAPQRGQGQEVAGTLTARSGEGFQGNDAYAGLLLPVAFGGGNRSGSIDVSSSLLASNAKGDFESETFLLAFNSNAQPDQMVFDPHVSSALTTSQYSAIAFDIQNVASSGTRIGPGLPTPTLNTREKMSVRFAFDDISPTLISGSSSPKAHGKKNGTDREALVGDGLQVRRLTPLEYERLQGMPDNYTAIKIKRKLAADGPRYKAIGNSMAVPVIRWIGRQIQIAEWFTA